VSGARDQVSIVDDQQMKLKTKQDYWRAFRVVKRVIDKWDPYYLIGSGAPLDEFEPEVYRILPLLQTILSEADAARAVSEVFSEQFEPEYFTPEQCGKVGSELFEELRREGLI
jgi:hypothetical protein